MQIIKDSVAFLMPCAAGVEPRAVQSAISVCGFATANGYIVRQVGVTDRTVVHTARNFLAKAFLESECEWGFWMDSDMILEPRTIPVMIQQVKRLNAVMATGIYCQRLGSHKPLVFIRDPITMDGKPLHPDKMPDDYSHTHVVPNKGATEPFKIDSAGFGCFLTHRSAFDKMEMPYFRNHFFGDGTKEVSEDFYFCIKARQLGMDIWAIPGLICGHIGSAPIITINDFVMPSSDIAPVQIQTVKQKDKYEWVETDEPKVLIGGKNK